MRLHSLRVAVDHDDLGHAQLREERELLVGLVLRRPDLDHCVGASATDAVAGDQVLAPVRHEGQVGNPVAGHARTGPRRRR
jgi:hypothetical protein